jgi:hypothetical protein
MTVADLASGNAGTRAWLLQAIYSCTGGDLRRAAILTAIRGDRAWNDVERAATYLTHSGLAQMMGRGKIRLTAAGAALAEGMVGARGDSPSVHVVQHFHGPVGAVQNGTSNIAIASARGTGR